MPRTFWINDLSQNLHLYLQCPYSLLEFVSYRLKLLSDLDFGVTSDPASEAIRGQKLQKSWFYPICRMITSSYASNFKAPTWGRSRLWPQSDQRGCLWPQSWIRLPRRRASEASLPLEASQAVATSSVLKAIFQSSQMLGEVRLGDFERVLVNLTDVHM